MDWQVRCQGSSPSSLLRSSPPQWGDLDSAEGNTPRAEGSTGAFYQLHWCSFLLKWGDLEGAEDNPPRGSEPSHGPPECHRQHCTIAPVGGDVAGGDGGEVVAPE